MAPRFYASSLPAGQVELSTSESHHAMHVLRLKAGDEVELFDGRGGLAQARIVQARHGKVSVELIGPVSRQEPYAPAIHLAFAIPRSKRVDWLLEKATELGATSLRPILTQRSVAGGEELSETQMERWLGHCISAAKQCGLNFLPQIHKLVPLEELLKQLQDSNAIQAPAGSPSPALTGDLSLQAGMRAIAINVVSRRT